MTGIQEAIGPFSVPPDFGPISRDLGGGGEGGHTVVVCEVVVVVAWRVEGVEDWRSRRLGAATTIGTESLLWFRGCFSSRTRSSRKIHGRARGDECCEAAEAHTITALLRYYYALQLHPSNGERCPRLIMLAGAHFSIALMMTRLEGAAGFFHEFVFKTGTRPCDHHPLTIVTIQSPKTSKTKFWSSAYRVGPVGRAAAAESVS